LDNSDKNKLFEEISNDYSMLLLNWAYNKTGNRVDAEDLSQKVMLQVFYSITKEQKIEKLDNFIWKIAHFVWCNYLRKNASLKQSFSIDSFDNNLLFEKDYAEKFIEEEDIKDTVKKMRLHISRLNYLQREIMIMHYIDEMPVKKIAHKLNITESNVKWHLFETRKKIKKEIEEMNTTNINYVYRPGKLQMAISGSAGTAPNTNKINESLTKQNICLVCYKEPKTIDAITEMLGIPKAYIEYDLKWLVEQQYMKKEGNKYYTMFSIKDFDFSMKVAKVFYENKAKFSDVIIEKFMARESEIKAIGFHGSDMPMEKLLWLLIYRFTGFICEKVVYHEKKYPAPERPIMPDGGQYFPLGFDRSDNDIKPEDYISEKYKEIAKWSSNGSMTHSTVDNTWFMWLGLYSNMIKH